MQPLAVLFTLTALLIIVLAVPMIRRSVPPNRFYGLRVPATLTDESVWYDANHRCGWDALMLGIVLLALAILLPLLGMDFLAYALAYGAATLVGSLLVTIISWRRANRLLRERQGSENEQ
jgi:uncharacterized membrane protein